MEKENLIKKSEDLCKTANEILAKTNAVEIFSKLGKVEIIGSLRLKMMYRLEIDLLVISETIVKN